MESHHFKEKMEDKFYFLRDYLSLFVTRLWSCYGKISYDLEVSKGIMKY